MGLRVAALDDVHGNLPALEAVLAQLDAVSVDLIVFGGDLVWGPWPSEVLERARALGNRTVFLHGNCETLVSEGATEPKQLSRRREPWIRTWIRAHFTTGIATRHRTRSASRH